MLISNTVYSIAQCKIAIKNFNKHTHFSRNNVVDIGYDLAGACHMCMFIYKADSSISLTTSMALREQLITQHSCL